jgi:hypothetical protein
MEKLSHAYIISGQAQLTMERAQRLSSEMLCTAPGRRPCGMCRNCVKAQKGIHPDILVTGLKTDDKGKAKREIYVDQVREIIDSSAVLPNEAEKKVYIIKDAGAMNDSAQNALLKLLEEPPEFDAFILLCDSPEQLLETVRSRCAAITLQADDGEPSQQAKALAREYITLAGKKDALALLTFLGARDDMPNAEAVEFIQACTAFITDVLCRREPDMGLSRGELMRLAALMERAGDYLRGNVSVKHVLGLLSARTIEIK